MDRHWCIAIIGDLGNDSVELRTALAAMRAEELSGNKIIEVSSLDRLSSVTDLALMETYPSRMAEGNRIRYEADTVIEVTELDGITSAADLSMDRRRRTMGWDDFTQPESLAAINAIVIANIDWPHPDAPTMLLEPTDVYRWLREGCGYQKPIFPATTDYLMNEKLQKLGATHVMHWPSFHHQLATALIPRL